jgi:hypothetical protein
VTNSAGLGNTSNGTTVRGGAALELANNITIGAETLTLSGAGISSGGALRNISGDNTYGGAITLSGGGALINSDSGALILTGGITTSGGQNLTFGGAGNTIVSNAVVSGAANLIKDGVGTLCFVVADNTNQSLCGDMALNAGKLQFTFNVTPSTTIAPIKILGNLTFAGTPTIKISANTGVIPRGVNYPLLTASGSVPTTVPNLELVGVTGTLKWGGTGNKTLVFAPPLPGTIISFL